MNLARRLFAVLWLVLAFVGALNHTIAPKIGGPVLSFNFPPHLRYGYVMFTHNPRIVPRVEYLLGDGIRFRPMTELIRTPALGYKNTRVAINYMLDPNYLWQFCELPVQNGREYSFRVTQYDVVASASKASYFLCMDGELIDY